MDKKTKWNPASKRNRARKRARLPELLDMVQVNPRHTAVWYTAQMKLPRNVITSWLEQSRIQGLLTCKSGSGWERVGTTEPYGRVPE